MDALTAVAPRRHPWLERLVAAPGAEVRALAEGTASIHPYRRAEPSDAAATLLFGLPVDDPALRAFDQGTLETLSRYRTATARNDREQRDRIALAALDLMTVVQRLAPRDTVIDLHRRFVYWNAWAETLVLDRGLDLRREYWRALALTQDIAEEAGLVPRRLLPFWLDMCSEAGRRGRYDESYLAVGLSDCACYPWGKMEPMKRPLYTGSLGGLIPSGQRRRDSCGNGMCSKARFHAIQPFGPISLPACWRRSRKRFPSDQKCTR